MHRRSPKFVMSHFLWLLFLMHTLISCTSEFKPSASPRNFDVLKMSDFPKKRKANLNSTHRFESLIIGTWKTRDDCFSQSRRSDTITRNCDGTYSKKTIFELLPAGKKIVRTESGKWNLNVDQYSESISFISDSRFQNELGKTKTFRVIALTETEFAYLVENFQVVELREKLPGCNGR